MLYGDKTLRLRLRPEVDVLQDKENRIMVKRKLRRSYYSAMIEDECLARLTCYL